MNPLLTLAARHGSAARWAAALAAAASPACSGEHPSLVVEVTVGHEADAFTRDPPVVRVDVQALDGEGLVVASAETAPGGSFDLGDLPVDASLTFEATGFDAAGARVVRGRTLSGLQPGAIVASVLPLFAQRTRTWSRPPGGLPAIHVAAPGGVLAERYLMVTGGVAASSEDGAPADPAASVFYDLLSLGGARGSSLPRIARSLVVRLSGALLVDEVGASWVDFDAGTTGDAQITAREGFFAELAGGRTVEGPAGLSFVVGPTRQGGAPGRAILAVTADGGLVPLDLLAPRGEAAAAWVDGVGLLVAGGSATAAGAEVLAPSATSFASTALPPDPVAGAGLVPVGAGLIALVGGERDGSPAPTRVFEAGCWPECQVIEKPELSLPLTLGPVSAYSLGDGSAVVLGGEREGERLMRSFLVDFERGTVEERPLREPRAFATVLPAPNGTLSVLGGSRADGSPVRTVETFFP